MADYSSARVSGLIFVGMIPNLAATMSESPTLIKGFVTLREVVQTGTLTPSEREIVLLTNAMENGCRYCTAIHSTFALGQGVSQETVDAIRSGGLPKESRHAALVKFARNLLRQKGNVGKDSIQEFLSAGFRKDQVLELVAALAMSVMANYSGHLTSPDPDEPIKAQYR